MEIQGADSVWGFPVTQSMCEVRTQSRRYRIEVWNVIVPFHVENVRFGGWMWLAQGYLVQRCVCDGHKHPSAQLSLAL